MYYPYFRGKQYELITIRENAELIARNNIVPITALGTFFFRKELENCQRRLAAVRIVNPVVSR